MNFFGRDALHATSNHTKESIKIDSFLYKKEKVNVSFTSRLTFSGHGEPVYNERDFLKKQSQCLPKAALKISNKRSACLRGQIEVQNFKSL